MTDFFSLTKPLLYSLSPETAHNAALFALKNDLLPPGRKLRPAPELAQYVFGLTFKSPIGLAAGFDKNASAVDALLKQGFGFVEAGTVTPLAQPGNPKPRIFRLTEDEAIINRLGFNNDGLQSFVKKFSARDKALGIAGANIGKNKDATDAVADYVRGLKAVYPHADYITINISSPNTQGLRDLQAKEALNELLAALVNARKEAQVVHTKPVPLLLKIAPDLDGDSLSDIAEAVVKHNIDGLIVSNTTISRPDSLQGSQKTEQGGLSGKPLMALSTSTLSQIYKLTEGKIPLIGVGGIASAEDAYAKIRAGASLVQIYSALVFQGFGLLHEINKQLPNLLMRDGYSYLKQAVGADHK